MKITSPCQFTRGKDHGRSFLFGPIGNLSGPIGALCEGNRRYIMRRQHEARMKFDPAYAAHIKANAEAQKVKYAAK